MKVKIKKLNGQAVTPFFAKKGDACVDLTSTSRIILEKYVQYSTGLAIEIPEGHVGLIFPRSSISNQDLILANCVGVIDSGYRGEILCRFKRTKNETFCSIYQPGEKIAQLMILPIPLIEFEEVEELSTTERGEGGFGSTGK